MKILFILPDHGHGNCVQFGVAYISSVLKSSGHKTDVLDFNKVQFKKEAINKKILEFNPGLVAISILSTHLFKQSTEIARIIKSFSKIPVVVGGVAVIVNPEYFTSCDYVDIICVGEGEYSFLELAEKMDKKRNYHHIKDFWFRNNGKWIKNEVNELIKDLDSLPFPDRGLFNLCRGGRIDLIAGRGCPFECTYCVNKALKNKYGAKGYIRQRSPENLIEEIIEIKKEYSPSSLWFYDDVFPLDKAWLTKFSDLYVKNRINIPFSINLRPEQVNDDNIRLLKNIGLCELRIGIEAGDESIRRNKLNRRISDSLIKKAFHVGKKYGITRKSYNIIGIPGETKESVFKTILLNLDIKPDFIQYSMFQPYPGTELYKECIEKGYIKKKVEDIPNYYAESGIETKNIKREEVRILFSIAKSFSENRVIHLVYDSLGPDFVKLLLHASYFNRKVVRKMRDLAFSSGKNRMNSM